MKYKVKTKFLFLLHLPPPIHGSSMVGKWIKESLLINRTANSRYINLLASTTIDETGKITVGKIFSLIRVAAQLSHELLFHCPDSCYLALTTTGVAFYRDLLLVTLLRLFNVKRIYHLHNKGILRASDNTINRFLYKFIFYHAKVIILSEYLYNDIEQFVNRDQVFICPNGIPEFSCVCKEKINSINPIKILFLSNMIESKGVLILLEAFLILKSKNILFEGIFVGGEGDISAAQFHEKVKEIGLEQQVRYLGKKYGSDKYDLLMDADVFAFPTFYKNECFPLVLLEAMQFGLPVVSTPEGGISDIVEDGVTGFLVQKMDEVTLAARLQELIQNPILRRQMGTNGKLKYEKKYTLKIFEERFAEILKQM